MQSARFPLLSLILLAGCGGRATTPAPKPGPGEAAGPPTKAAPVEAGGRLPAKASLVEARRAFKTKLIRQEKENEPADKPPPRLFRLVRYDAPAGKLAAYLSQNPGDGKKHPAILWVFGGFSNSIGGGAWAKPNPKNDQSASAYWRSGIVMMYPSFRGGNDNPGYKEGFLGEVDDLLAAADYLAKQDFVDPNRIYLGGHSTGGTMALLAAESSPRFRATFAFGPVDDVTGYGRKYTLFDTSNPKEAQLRAPIHWLDAVRSPVFVFEGTKGNIDSLRAMARTSHNPMIHFYPVKGATHFTILGPVNQLDAGKILRDTGPTCNITFTEEELNKLFAR